MIKKTKWLLKEAGLRIKYMTSSDCLFCKLIKEGGWASKPILETESVIAVNDINPVAEIHILIIPKKHIESVLTIGKKEGNDLVEMFAAAREIIASKNLDGFRLAFNGGKFQHVPHLHVHLLSGGAIKWSKL